MSYVTQDFYSAAILRASGVPLTNVVKVNGNFCSFYFNISQHDCEDILQRHWNRTLTVPSRNLIDSIVELKTRIHGF
jgi:hypothetical protein